MVDGPNCVGWIRDRDLNTTAPVLLHEQVAKDHRPDLVICLNRSVSWSRAACAEDDVWTGIDREVPAQELTQVDFGEDCEVMLFQRFRVVATASSKLMFVALER